MSSPIHDAPGEDDESKEAIKKRKYHDTQQQAGCGYGKYKKRLMDLYWGVLWPGLEKLGWTKQQTTGQRQGYITAFCLPQVDDFSILKYTKGKDYYVKIKDIIDRICGDEANGAEEIALGKRFQEEFELNSDRLKLQIGDASDVPIPRSRRRNVNRNKETASKEKIDLSWKYDGVAFPKASSRVGAKYQAPEIPEAGTFQPTMARDDPDLQTDQMWDHKLGAETISFVESLPPNEKEASLRIIHEQNYKTDGVKQTLSKVDYKDGSNWSPTQREHFHDEMFRLRKNIVAVAKSTGFGVNACYAYYLAKFKKSDDYRLLKTICEEERAEKLAASEQLDACGVCGDGGSLLICDGCEGEFHMTCLRPPLVSVPEGVWHCDSCVDIKFLDIRDKLVQKLYVEVVSKKRKADDMVDASPNTRKARNKVDDSVAEVIMQPSETVLAAVKDLAAEIAKALGPSFSTSKTIEAAAPSNPSNDDCEKPVTTLAGNDVAATSVASETEEAGSHKPGDSQGEPMDIG